MQPAPSSQDEAFSAIPVANTAIRVQTTEQGYVRISYPIHLNRWLARLLPRGASLPLRTLELDGIGSFVWQHIDGRSSVQHLAERVAERYALQLPEARQAVAAFIRQLGRRGIVVLQ
jgi:hypothetical protein